MKSLYLDEADPEALSHAVREVLQAQGWYVSEHRHSRVRFFGTPPGARFSWTRDGYVGIYQPLGETSAEVRVRVRARWPWRILLAVAAVDLVACIATFLVNPGGTGWSLVAILTGFSLLVAGLVYVNTLSRARAEERALADAFEASFAALPDAQVEREDARLARTQEAQLEGEIVHAQIERQREPSPRGRFSLRPGSK